MSEQAAVGIDLGTSYFRVGVYRNERFEIILNDEGKRKTPCYVTLIGDKWVIGDVAKHRAHEDIKNTFYSSKRIIVRSYEDLGKLVESKHWPFECLKSDEKTKIKVNEGRMEILPIELSARILCKAREMAERHLKRKVTKAVLTVPECFTEQQRKAILQAGVIAGLEVLDIIADPVAAAISYLLESEAVGATTRILVLSVGGGSYDVSIVSLTDDKIETLYKTGDANLGGQDFDIALFEFFKKKINTPKELTKSASFLFLQECRKAKESLVQCESFRFSGEKLDEDVPFLTMRNEHFKTVVELRQFVERISSSVKKAVDEAAVKGYSIDEAVLIGGCTRIKSIQECLNHATVPISHILNVDEAVVQGAAYHSYALSCTGARLFVNRLLSFDNKPSLEPDFKKIQNKIENERPIMEQKRLKEAKMNEFESFIDSGCKILRRDGLSEADTSSFRKPYRNWTSDNSSSASIDDIDRKKEEFCNAVKEMQRKCSENTSIVESNREAKETKTNCYKTKAILQTLTFNYSKLQFSSCATQCFKVDERTLLTVDYDTKKIVYVQLNPTCSEQQYSFWWCDQNLQYHLSKFTMVDFKNMLTLIGGYNEKDNTYSNLISIWNGSSLQPFSDMPTHRCNALVTVHEDYILVAGGINETGPLSGVEILDTKHRQWRRVLSLPPPSNVQLKHDNSWYLIGDRVYLASLPELVKNSTDYAWTIFNDAPLKNSCLAFINEYIIAIGSHADEGERGQQVYYLSARKKWKSLCNLKFDGEIRTCITLNKSTILVFGSGGNVCSICTSV